MVIAIRRMIIKNVPKPGFDKGKVYVLWGDTGTERIRYKHQYEGI